MAEWNPWKGMEDLRREVNRAFEDFGFRTEPFSRSAFLPGRGARRYPLINLYEDKDTMYVEALAPGVAPESLDLTVVGNLLTISGEKRRLSVDVKPEAFHRSERATGKLVRHVELPVEVDDNKVQANYDNGLIIVTLPKAEKVKPRQIDVQVG
jgi:HSP20 family protein